MSDRQSTLMMLSALACGVILGGVVGLTALRAVRSPGAHPKPNDPIEGHEIVRIEIFKVDGAGVFGSNFGNARARLYADDGRYIEQGLIGNDITILKLGTVESAPQSEWKGKP